MLALVSPFQRYGVAALLVVLALALRVALVGQGYLFLFFYPAVAAAAWWGGVGPGLAAAALSGLLVNLILIPPVGTLNLRPEEIIQAVTFVAAAGVVGWLTGRAREAAAERELLLGRERAALAEADEGRERLTLLTDASSALAGSLDYDATLQRVVRLTVPRLADWCTLNLVDPDGRVRRTAAAHQNPAREPLLFEVLARHPIGADEPRGIATVLRTGQPQLNPELSDADLETVARDADHLRLLRELGPSSSLIAPLVVAGRPVGALELTYGPSGRRYGPADLPLVEELARRAAVAIENARLYQEARLATEQLAAALDELRRAQSRIVEQERLRAMGEMASGIAHDFNNQLAIIVGLTDPELWSDDRLGDRVSVAGTLAAIASAADDAAEVVRRLREFYRPSGDSGGERGRLDLGELVAQVVAATQPRWRGQALGRGATIDVRVDVASAAPVLGSASELREALTNLIFNAVDAMPTGGTITLRVAAEGEQVALTVADTGAGMPEEVRRRCFEPFYTTKGTSGSGLGLAMVFGIVQRHGGTIEVASAPGAGTTFTVRLPAVPTSGNPAPAAAEAPAAGAREAPAEPTRSLRVLVAEDNPVLRAQLIAFLRAAGHRVEVAEDGQAALSQMDAGDFDLVVTDRAMPGLSGDQLAAEVKRRAPATAVIMLTGFGDLMQATGETPPGVDMVLSKPLPAEGLERAIARLEARRR